MIGIILLVQLIRDQNKLNHFHVTIHKKELELENLILIVLIDGD